MSTKQSFELLNQVRPLPCPHNLLLYLLYGVPFLLIFSLIFSLYRVVMRGKMWLIRILIIRVILVFDAL